MHPAPTALLGGGDEFLNAAARMMTDTAAAHSGSDETPRRISKGLTRGGRAQEDYRLTAETQRDAEGQGNSVARHEPGLLGTTARDASRAAHRGTPSGFPKNPLAAR
jgi:hypothetical protein